MLILRREEIQEEGRDALLPVLQPRELQAMSAEDETVLWWPNLKPKQQSRCDSFREVWDRAEAFARQDLHLMRRQVPLESSPMRQFSRHWRNEKNPAEPAAIMQSYLRRNAQRARAATKLTGLARKVNSRARPRNPAKRRDTDKVPTRSRIATARIGRRRDAQHQTKRRNRTNETWH